MQVIVLGAGTIGVSTAWHLMQQGHDVIVVDRRADSALEASYAGAGHLAAGSCEPWASPWAPKQLALGMLRRDAPFLFRPGLDWRQWRWGLQFLAQCHPRAFRRNMGQLVALARYSHEALDEMVDITSIRYSRRKRGVAHFYTSQESFAAARRTAGWMRDLGVQREVITREELLRIEPALTPVGGSLVGGTYTRSDESGDQRVFTQELAALCAQRGALFLYGHDVEQLSMGPGDSVDAVRLRERATNYPRVLHADAFVVCCGSYSGQILRSVEIDLPVYPAKGYSASFDIVRPDQAPIVGLYDGKMRLGISRLGNSLRVAGAAEFAGFDASPESPMVQPRYRALAKHVEQLFPGACDTHPRANERVLRFWCGLQPSMPNGVPYIGRVTHANLWAGVGHGALGWTLGAGTGKALAELISGRKPELSGFRFAM